MKITMQMADAAIDAAGDDEDGLASNLADVLDEHGEWDWTDDSEHGPSDRLAIVESSGAWWVVYRGAEPDAAERFGDMRAARAKFTADREGIESTRMSSP